jgi:hypothetical protein
MHISSNTEFAGWCMDGAFLRLLPQMDGGGGGGGGPSEATSPTTMDEGGAGEPNILLAPLTNWATNIFIFYKERDDVLATHVKQASQSKKLAWKLLSMFMRRFHHWNIFGAGGMQLLCSKIIAIIISTNSTDLVLDYVYTLCLDVPNPGGPLRCFAAGKENSLVVNNVRSILGTPVRISRWCAWPHIPGMKITFLKHQALCQPTDHLLGNHWVLVWHH